MEKKEKSKITPGDTLFWIIIIVLIILLPVLMYVFRGKYALKDIGTIISAYLVFIMSCVTIRMTKTNLKKSQILEKELSIKRINADIITKSRIAWIQDVRAQAATTLQSYNEYMNAHLSSNLREATVSYYEYIRHLEIIRLYFPKEKLKDKYDFKLTDLRKKWKSNDSEPVMNLLERENVKEYFCKMVAPEDESNVGRNSYINDYAKQLQIIEYSLYDFRAAEAAEVSQDEIGRNLSANEYYLRILIDAIGNYLKVEWEAAKKFESTDLGGNKKE